MSIRFETDVLRQQLVIFFRDFGPGIQSGQEDKILELFYRGEDELTRTTSGTGIGLALVQKLMASQRGKIYVRRCTPGLAFELHFELST